MSLKSHRLGVILLALILLLSGVGAWWVKGQHQEQRIAEIYLSDQKIRTIDLDQVQEPYRFRVDAGEGAYNVIQVSAGAIAVAEANCKDQICVHQGAISDGIEPIVCLPHRLLIKINSAPTEDAPGYDAVTK